MGRTVNMEGVGNYEPAPAGQYTVTFAKGEWDRAGERAKHPGEEYYKWQLTIADEIEGASGKTIYRNWNLLPQSLFVMRGDLQVLGYEEAFGEGALDANDFDVDAAIEWATGRRALATVVVQEYRYPEGHQKYGQTRRSNDITKLEQLEIPEMLAPASRRRG